MKKILTSYRPPTAVVERYSDNYDLIMPDEKQMQFSRQEILERLPEADALWLVGQGIKADPELIDAGPLLQAIGTLAVGYDNIDWQYAGKRNIAVINTPNSLTEATAELAISLMLAAMRSIARQDAELRRSGKLTFSFYDSFSVSAYGKTIGIVGFGRIGKAVARKARGLGMKVIYYDIIRADGEVEKELGAEFMPFEDLLQKADVVSMHMPLLPETTGLMGLREFSLMKSDAYFVNAARGGLVRESELAQALQKGLIKGAGLDVFENEPYVNSSLLSLKNVVLTPHVGSWTSDTRLAMAYEVMDGIASVLNGVLPENTVNRMILKKSFI